MNFGTLSILDHIVTTTTRVMISVVCYTFIFSFFAKFSTSSLQPISIMLFLFVFLFPCYSSFSSSPLSSFVMLLFILLQFILSFLSLVLVRLYSSLLFGVICFVRIVSLSKFCSPLQFWFMLFLFLFMVVFLFSCEWHLGLPPLCSWESLSPPRGFGQTWRADSPKWD